MQKENLPVSIIVRTKDRPVLLKHAIKSIAQQTYRPIEVVLVNDGGCDLDAKELKGILGDVSLNYIRLEKNTGRAHAGNVGIENAKGEYIGFLDDDDEFYPEHVETLAAFLTQSDYKVAYTDAEMVFRKYDVDIVEYTDEEKYVFSSRDFSFHELLLENYIPFINVLFHRDVFPCVGRLDEQLIAFEDWDFFIRCGSIHPFSHVDKVTAKYIQWSKEQQIAQCREFWSILDKEYDKVIGKHCDLFSPKTVRSLRDAFKALSAGKDELAAAVSESQREISQMNMRATQDRILLDNLYKRNTELEEALKDREEYIRRIQSGRGWWLLLKYYKVRDRLFAALHSAAKVKS
jgi:glycosyltransferase involved in cell wall biosynthesis